MLTIFNIARKLGLHFRSAYLHFFQSAAMYLIAVIILLYLTGCAASKNYSPEKKFPRAELQQDYSLLRTILEKKHPSLYWYTPKDSMDKFFSEGYRAIEDSMTELQFGWKIIAPLTHKIHCGHTSFSMSSGWNRFVRHIKLPSFPLHLKIWADTMVVVLNLNAKDTLIRKGMLITAINGMRSRELINKMKEYLAQDAYAENVINMRLSMGFPYFHRNIFGLYKSYAIQYIDSSGIEKHASIPYFDPAADSLEKKPPFPAERLRLSRRQKIERIRSLTLDPAGSLATLKLNSFSGGHLPKFFRRSFKTLHRSNIQNLVVDVRNNGGGNINNYVNLTRYIRHTPFKVADTAASIEKNFRPYSKYIKAEFLDKPGLFFLTKKRSDNKYHFTFWERRIIKPKKRYHFSGDVYVLTNGLTFSASALFCNAVKGQPNVKIVGEETGGAWYGNSGIVIPDILLPNTKLKVRLPFFRLVQYNHVAKNGTGIIPDVVVAPTVYDVRNGIDRKMSVVKDMILNKTAGKPNHDPVF